MLIYTVLTNWDKSHFNLDKPCEKKIQISKNYDLSHGYEILVKVPNKRLWDFSGIRKVGAHQ